MAEKGASFIPIEDFRPDYHDPDEWLDRFEKAVVLATNCRDDDRKKELYVAWLPMKLNDATRLMMSDALSAATAATWANVKTQFKSQLITPQDKYNWRSGRKRITWDGQENFHSLAARVKRTIDRYEDRPSEADYYHEFRSALPRNYQQAIDLGHTAETLAEGKRIAFRCQAALACDDEDTGTAKAKSVAFVGGSMIEASHENRLKTIEMGLQGMSVKVDNLCSDVEKNTKDVKAREERARSPTPPRSDQYRPRGGDVGFNEGDPRRRSSPERRYDRYDSRERFRPRYQDQDRFDYDDYSYSLGQGQRGGGRTRGYDYPPQNYERRYGESNAQPQRPQQGWGQQGYNNSGARGYSPDGSRRSSPNRGGGYNPGQNRGFSPSRGRNQGAYGNQGYAGGGRNEGRPPPTAPSAPQPNQGQGNNYRGLDYDEQYQWFCQAVLEKEQKDARPPTAPPVEWGQQNQGNY